MNRFLPFLSQLAAALNKSDGWVSSPPSPLRPRYHPLGTHDFGICLKLKNVVSALPVIALILSASVAGFGVSGSFSPSGKGIAQHSASINVNNLCNANGFNAHHDRLTLIIGDSNTSEYHSVTGNSRAHYPATAVSPFFQLPACNQTALPKRPMLSSSCTINADFNQMVVVPSDWFHQNLKEVMICHIEC